MLPTYCNSIAQIFPDWGTRNPKDVFEKYVVLRLWLLAARRMLPSYYMPFQLLLETTRAQ
eukprot:924069-Amphidinium_carterae.1